MDRRYPEFVPDSSAQVVLERWLDYQRAGVTDKVRGLSDEEALRSPVGSGTSVSRLVRHLVLVEDYWFAAVMAGERPLPEDAEFESIDRDEGDVSLGTAAMAYTEACQRSRRIQERLSLDDASVLSFGGQKYRYDWVLTHMIEESARHLGHLDIVAEWVDGRVGQ